MSLKRPFFIIIIFLILFISSFVFYTNKALLYSPETTHYNLSQEMIKLYNLTYEPDLTPRQTEWILRGTIDEDIKPRPLFHMYDPIYNRAPLGVTTAKEWALNYDIQQLEAKKFATLGEFIRTEGDYNGNFSWMASIKAYVNNDKDYAYYALGHILHLIEDMTVPAHSRNDPHAGGDPYEDWANINNGTINFNLAEPLYNKGYRPADFYTIGEYFDNLAKYSNKYFFSQDSVIGTNLGNDYKDPKIVFEKEEDFGKYLQRTYAIGLDENGGFIRLAYKDYYKSTWREISPSKKKTDNIYVIDEKEPKIHQDYWNRLAPKAVMYGAGVIKLFLEEAGYEVRKAANQPPELSWFQRAQIFIQDLFGIGEDEQEQIVESIIPSQPLPQPKPARFPDGGPAILPQSPATPATEIYLVQRVIDGDTILLENGQTVRYIGINAPELPNGCFSQQALEKNKELVEGKKVLLEKDVSEKDSYGRILRYVYLDSVFINKYLVANGYAYDLVIAPDIKYSQELVQAEETAKKLKSGLWGETCHPMKEGEVKGESIEKEQREDKGGAGAVVVTGPKTGGGGGASRPDTQELTQPPTQPPTPIEPPTTEPEDTTPPNVLIKSLVYNYASSSLIIEWSSSEIPSVSFDVEYKQGDGDWQDLLASTSETQSSLSISVQDIVYYFRVKARDEAANESEWQEKSIEILSKPVVINEIAWMGTQAQANDEWMELYNRAEYDVDLDGWILEAADGTPTVNLTGIISSHSYFLLERTADETISNILADQIYTGALNNPGENLILKNNNGNITDQVDCSIDWYAGNNESKRTMERVNPAVAGTDSKNWQTYIDSGSGATDVDSNPILGTPKAQNSVFDANPPSKIDDLAVSDSLGTFLILQWTAPSDEKSSISLAYDIHYASESISEENWASASQISDIPLVENPNILQTLNISGLKYDTIYYFAIKTSDGLNVSELSNILVYSTGSSPTLANSAWPLFQRDVGHTGLSPYAGPEFTASSSISPKWISDLGAPIYASPIIGLDGTIYVGDIMGKFYAINPNNGNIKWVYDTYNYELGKGGIYFSAAIASDGTIYFSAFGSYLYALTPNGKLKWKYPIGNPNTTGSSPAIVSDGTIYLTGNNTILFAINPDGTLKWQYYINEAASVSTPALGSDETIYVSLKGTATPGYLIAVDSDGNLKWISENIAASTGEIIAIDSNDIIYLGSSAGLGWGSLLAINSVDGSLIWVANIGNVYFSPALALSGNVYAVRVSGLYAINSNGEFIWNFGAGADIGGSPIIDSNEVIYFGSTDKKIYAINSDGSLKWSYELSDSVYSSPIMGSDGTIYIATIDGKFYAIRE